jgi:hypothetical protein
VQNDKAKNIKEMNVPPLILLFGSSNKKTALSVGHKAVGDICIRARRLQVLEQQMEQGLSVGKMFLKR